MARYKIWDKQETLYTPIGEAIPAADYIATRAGWAANPAVKVIISGGPINCGVFQEFSQTVEHYKRLGAAITDTMTDAEVLAVIEAFEDTPPVSEPSAEERIAAALEFQNLEAM